MKNIKKPFKLPLTYDIIRYNNKFEGDVMELRDLRFFAMAAQMQHISRAADRLGVSQPFLTKVIKQLENELGAVLLEPSGRGVVLTECGEYLLRKSTEILKSVDEIYDDISGILGEKENTVKLMTDAGGYMPAMIYAYKQHFPEKKLSISYGFRDDIIRSVESCSVDFALVTPPLGGTELRHISQKIVYREYAGVILPPDDPLLECGVVDIEKLRDKPLVTSPIGAGVRNNLELFFAKYGFKPKIMCESNDINIVFKGVLGGLGYAFMPKIVTLDNSVGKLYRDINVDEYGEVALCWRTSNDANANTAEFIGFVSTFFDELNKKLSDH